MLSTLRPTLKLVDHTLSTVRDCLFNIFAATQHNGDRSSIRNLRTRHSVVTDTHTHTHTHIYIYISIIFFLNYVFAFLQEFLLRLPFRPRFVYLFILLVILYLFIYFPFIDSYTLLRLPPYFPHLFSHITPSFHSILFHAFFILFPCIFLPTSLRSFLSP